MTDIHAFHEALSKWLGNIIRFLKKSDEVSDELFGGFLSEQMISIVMEIAFLQHRILSSVFFHCK